MRNTGPTPQEPTRPDSEERPSWVALLGCVVLAGVVYLLMAPGAAGTGLETSATVTGIAPADPTRLALGLAIFVLVGGLWMSQALHLSITALLVPVLASVAGLMTPREAFSAFAQPVIFLFMGGFALAAALSKQGMDRALAHAVLRLAGGRQVVAVLLLFLLTALLSMWLSNTATAAMMLPLALGLLGQDAPLRTRAFVLLGLAYSASIGGMGTLVGSPPNAIAAAQAGLSFADWLAVGLPAVAVLLPLAWATLYGVLRPELGGGTATPASPATAYVPLAWTPARITTAAIFGFTVLGWVFSAPLGRWLGVAQDMDALVAVAAIVLLGATGVLRWPDFERHTQWGVLLLFGGGLTLSQIMATSGASLFLAQGLVSWVGGAPAWLVLLAVVGFVVVLTELVSNTASAALLIPIVMGMAPALGLDAPGLAVAVALAASCAFMLPVATPPNAIVFGSGQVSQRDMMRCGLVLNSCSTLAITALIYSVV